MESCDPFTRRKTAPARVGILKSESSKSLEFFELSGRPRPIASKEIREKVQDETDEDDDDDDVITLSPSPPAPEPATESDNDEEYTEYSIFVNNSSGVKMLEFKPSCKLEVTSAVTMSLKEESFNIYGSSLSNKISNKVAEEEEKYKGPGGSVYGAKERKAAIRAKYKIVDEAATTFRKTIRMEVKDAESKQYLLNGKQRKIEDIKSEYFALTNDGGRMVAHPVQNWTVFDKLAQNKTLSYEDAEDIFKKRKEVLNLFSVMVNKKINNTSSENEPEKVKSGGQQRKKTFDESGLEYMDSENEDEEGSEGEIRDAENSNANKKRKRRNKKTQKKKESDADAEDEGEGNSQQDEEQAEINYYGMNSSSSDSEPGEDENEKTGLGVADEEAMLELLRSSGSEKSDQEGKVSVAEPEKVKVLKKRGRKKKLKPSIEEEDEPKLMSMPFVPLVLKKDASSGDWNVNKKNVEKEESPETQKIQKVVQKPRKILDISANLIREAAAAGVTQESIRRYLTRKPIGIPQLLRKFSYATSKGLLTQIGLTTVVSHFLKLLKPLKESGLDGKVQLFIPTEDDLDAQNYFATFGSQSKK